MTALDELAKYIRTKNIDNPVIVSPDAGRASTAEKLANYLHAPFAMVVTNHDNHTGEEKMHVIGEVKGMTPIIIEDIIDTGQTLRKSWTSSCRRADKRLWSPRRMACSRRMHSSG